MEKNSRENLPSKLREQKGFSFRVYVFFKRFFDIMMSFLGIVILSPLLIVLSLIVIFSSKGGAFFADKRIGKNGKDIKVLKFRSMYKDAESNPEKYLSPEQLLKWQTERKIENDPRVTKVGRFLRKSSLDELPQLFNILFGSMSIVGPRPITYAEYTENFSEEERKVLTSVRPGLTGYWQVYGRSNVSYETGERQKLELKYFEKMGFLTDTVILFKTVPAVLKQEGAK